MAKLRLTDAQLRNQREQALRALRRKQRTVDTKLEKIERQMDRAIENKEKITIRLIDGIVENYQVFVKEVNLFQTAIADAIQIFMSS